MSKTVKIDAAWKGDLTFEADVTGHKIKVDGAPKDENNPGNGANPKPLMLLALAGCTGMDVVSILKKMKIEGFELNVEVEAEMRDDEHPKIYTEMKTIYRFKGQDLPHEKVKRAVELSQEKYCGVNAMYKMFLPVSYEIVYE